MRISSSSLQALTCTTALLVLGLGLFPDAFPQDQESLAHRAEQAGRPREALSHYVAALQVVQGDDADQRIRERIIALAQNVKPRPVVPEEAKRHFVAANSSMGNAKTQSDYTRAIAEYRQALLLAPWFADAYNNLGFVLERTGDYAGAKRMLRLYLETKPNLLDARSAQDKIDEVEVKERQAQKEEEARQELRRRQEAEERLRREEEQRRQQVVSLLQGVWELDDKYPRGRGQKQYQITRTGDTYTIKCSERRFPTDDPWGASSHWGLDFYDSYERWELTLSGTTMQGSWIGDETVHYGKPVSNGMVFTRPARGEVNLYGQTIRLRYSYVFCTINKNKMVKDCNEEEESTLNLRKLE